MDIKIKISDIRKIEEETNRTERIGQALVNRNLLPEATDQNHIFYCPDSMFYKIYGPMIDWNS